MFVLQNQYVIDAKSVKLGNAVITVSESVPFMPIFLNSYNKIWEFVYLLQVDIVIAALIKIKILYKERLLLYGDRKRSLKR